MMMFQPKHGPYAESLKRAFPGVSTLLTNGASRFLFLKGKLRVLEALPKPLTQTERMNTMESRFFEPPREMKIGLKSRKLENSKVLYKTPIYHLELERRSGYSQSDKL